MTSLVWDNVGDRVYQSGLDRGVLYLQDGSAVPWNGLTEVSEKTDVETKSVYFDGMKVNQLVSPADFSGVISAITYPDEFVIVEGFGEVRDGVFIGEQAPQSFGLCYRTRISNDLDSEAGYKLHIWQNVVAVPQGRAQRTITDSVDLTPFGWDIWAIPEEVPGFRPSAHMVIDSRTIDPGLLDDLEDRLYGTEDDDPILGSFADLFAFLSSWFRIQIIDHGDGSWSAVTSVEGLFEYVDEDETEFIIYDANATYSDPETYTVTDTEDIDEI